MRHTLSNGDEKTDYLVVLDLLFHNSSNNGGVRWGRPTGLVDQQNSMNLLGSLNMVTRKKMTRYKWRAMTAAPIVNPH